MVLRASRTSRARSLRRKPTDAEALLWRHLRNRQINDWKFKRQFPIDRYVADFACAEPKIVVELDGGQHALSEQADALRTSAIEAMGYIVLRFWNNDVLTNMDGVLAAIASVCSTESAVPPHPNPLPDGEREQS